MARFKRADISQFSSACTMSVDFGMRQTDTSETSAKVHQTTRRISGYNKFNLLRQRSQNSNFIFISLFVIFRQWNIIQEVWLQFRQNFIKIDLNIFLPSISRCVFGVVYQAYSIFQDSVTPLIFKDTNNISRF